MNKIFVISLSVLILSSLVSISPSLALPPLTEQKITASDAVAGDSFGGSVSISGDTAVVGAQDNDSSGSVYVFTRSGNTWSEQQKLTASDGASGDIFGRSVTVSGDNAIVGASGDNDVFVGIDTGSAYIFTRSGTTWTEQQKLTASDAAVQDRFGGSVSISGDTAVVGAIFDDDEGFESGSAYVFTRSGTTWTEQQKLTASDGRASDRFGGSVSISGDTVVVGVQFDRNDGGALAGSAYVFTRSGTIWTEQQKLTASDAAPSDLFGVSVSISGDTVVVGAVGDDDDGSSSGSFYVFTRSGTTWTEQQKLTASDAAASDQFGQTVAVSGDAAVVGAIFDDDDGSESGSVYVFTRSGTTWTEQQKLTASDAAAGDRFSNSVSISGDNIVVGAIEDDDAGSDSGSAYVYFVLKDGDGVVGGELIPIETTSLLIANAQTFSWMIPAVLSGIGIGLFVVSRKSKFD